MMSHFTIWRVAEPDGAVAEPARCSTSDEKHSWDRQPGESADAFEQRAALEAVRRGYRALVALSDTPAGEA